jgi:NADP-dependent 3-hydroxy acid dehydrogenase YdfG
MTRFREQGVDLRSTGLDVASRDSADAAIESILSEQHSFDVIIHNAGHMVNGTAEAFTRDAIVQVYDTNVVGTHGLNCAALPHLRAQEQGLVLWVGSSSLVVSSAPLVTLAFVAKVTADFPHHSAYPALAE